MSTLTWVGGAPAVAQVATATFGTYDTGTTRRITIGNTYIEAADSGGSLTNALTALAVLLNASTHPYFSAITWTSNATQIIGTADTAGVPFVFTGSVSGGTGTLSNAYTVSTASAGPYDWSTAANWSTGAVPVNSDSVHLKDSAVNIAYGIDQNGVTLTDLIIHQSYTGKVGLNRAVFAQSTDGATTTNSSYIEYRETHLCISCTNPVRIGENNSPATSLAGSPRILLNTGSTAAVIEVLNTGTPSESGRPAVRLKANSSSTDVHVRYAPGGVGIAVDTPGTTTTVRKVSVSDTGSTSRVFVGAGVTCTTFEQNGGNNSFQAAATLTTLTMNGGTLVTEGNYTITTVNANGGTYFSNHVKSAGNAITTLNINGGTVDAQTSTRARTWATVNVTKGTLKADGAVMTITTLNDPSGKYVLQAS